MERAIADVPVLGDSISLILDETGAVRWLSSTISSAPILDQVRGRQSSQAEFAYSRQASEGLEWLELVGRRPDGTYVSVRTGRSTGDGNSAGFAWAIASHTTANIDDTHQCLATPTSGTTECVVTGQ